MSKDITSYNDKGQRHGYCERYFSDGKLGYKGYYVNDEPYGYYEMYYSNRKLRCKTFYII